MTIVAKTDVEVWQEARHEWRVWGTMDLVLPADPAGRLADVAELVRAAFDEFAKKSVALAGHYRIGGGLRLQWIDGVALITMMGGPRDLTCGRCHATVTTAKQLDETVNCPECGYTLTVASF